MKTRRSRFTGKHAAWLLSSTLTVSFTAGAGEGLYIGVGGGINFLDKQKYDLYYPNGGGLVDDGTEIGQIRFKDGWAGGLVLGYSTDSGLRPELELLYRRNDLDHIHIEPAGLLSGLLTPNGTDPDGVEGKQDAQTAMVNLWLDLFRHSRVRPYAGLGAGAARIAIRDSGYDGEDFNNTATTAFAYQAGAGLGFDLSDRLTLSFDYRYLRTDRSRFNLLRDDPATRVRFRYEAQTALLSLRYSFGQPAEEAPPPAPPPVEVVAPVEPPAPPPPPPPPCEAPKPGQPFSLEGCEVGQTLVLHGVNFEFDKSRLTANAKTLLDMVADALLARQDIQIEIAGHTDSKGADAYNQKLSESRADAVKLYLIERGIDGSRMSTVGYGETRPIVDNATDEGRELNRRVELRVTGSNPADGPAPTVASPGPEGDVLPPPAEPSPAL
ncbi:MULTISPECIES: OmpA family protein [Hydrocarboniphaga]|jgi:outer membrane protein OmpA-like peptidoglycan-associated protein|uniref:OmpA-like domain-containing protein n=1 Tax=Hydrocarboniphaga effusa AP103 TaxID=1172194 RepID=I7ZIV8_9GAMM|nr:MULTISPECIES: OmpA family protein [Hydrocarboniphaga]EIT71687.1 hypothetical protein WQQ_18240 [Hydrocarboniphaga effusa AP103]MDZ4080311.1 OmpA family protein [Hydrocarboniphaga sp.]